MHVCFDFDPLGGDLLARAAVVGRRGATRPRNRHCRYLKEIIQIPSLESNNHHAYVRGQSFPTQVFLNRIHWLAMTIG